MKSTRSEASAPPAPAVRSENSKNKPKPRRFLIKLLLLILLMLSPFLIVQTISLSQEPRIYNTVQETPARAVAIVFGAGLNRDGSPSPILADRVNAAIALFRAGKVQSLLMTGDEVGNVEPTAMRNYAVRQGIPSSAILLDTNGLRTYDSCYRAVHTFNVKEAVLVTQGYHLPRALYTCNSLGINAVGLKAGRDSYPNQEYYNNREFFATLLSWFEVNVTRPIPSTER